MILANDLKRGMVIQLDQAPCLVLDVSFQSPPRAAAARWSKPNTATC